MSVISGSSGQAATMAASMHTTLVNAGWGSSGSVLPITYTKTYNGKVLDFTFAEFNASYLRFISGGLNYYIHLGATDVTGNFTVYMSASDDLVYIQVMGPTAGALGAKDATYGSNTGFFMIAPYEPYWAADSTVANHFVVMSSSDSNSQTTHTASGRIRKGLDGTDWQPFELATMRPAIQDIDAVGDLIPGIYQFNQVVWWDFVIVEQGKGVRGRLKDIYMGGENYYNQLSGDSLAATQKHSAYQQVKIGGVNHYAVKPFFQPNGVANQYSPFGVPDKTITVSNSNSRGGPVIAVKWV